MLNNMQQTKQKSVVREYVEAILIALVLALFIRTFVVQAFKIPSGSMLPTLQIGDHILVSKFSYGVRNPFTGAVWIPLGEPERHDVIVFRFPEDPSLDYIKRVVAVAGDDIEIRDKKVYINGVYFYEPNAIFLDPKIIPASTGLTRDNLPLQRVPPNAVFVLGDNRDNSLDSRFWGFVDLQKVKGRAFMLYWSWDKENFAVRWNRIGDIIP